jgi:UDP-N-acetylglucosamine 2-epimerase
VGKPHLEERRRATQPLIDRPLELLVISSVSDPAQATESVMAIRRALPKKWKVIFRTHPAERALERERYSDIASNNGVEFDEKPDVLNSLASARVVVGVSSTVLFEALAMGCRVVVRDDVSAEFYVGDLFGRRASSTEELVQLVSRAADENRSMSKINDIEKVWASWSPGAFQAALSAFSVAN